MSDPNDPGWREAWRQAGWGLIPQVGQRRLTRLLKEGKLSALVATRAAFLGFSLALVGFGVILAFLDSGSGVKGTTPSGPAAAVIVVVGLLSFAERRIEQPLSCESDAKLAGTYRTRFFLRVAFAEAVALFGFVAVFLTGVFWLYPLAVVFTAVGFARLAPTAGNLTKDQQELYAAGCGRSLVAALATPHHSA